MKKIISLVLAIAVLLPNTFIASAAEQNIASVIFSANGAQTTNMSVTTGVKDSFSSETVGGREAWKLGSAKEDNCFINLDITDAAASDYENYRMDVTYYDGGNGNFYIRYDAKSGTKELEPIILRNSGEWKTASVYLMGAALNNGISTSIGGKCDIVFSSNKWSSYSLSPVYISKVELYDMGTENKAEITLQSAPQDLVFYPGAEQKISYSIDNPMYDSRLEGNAKISVLDENGTVIYSRTEAVSIAKNGTANKTSALNISKYGVHKVLIEVTEEEHNIYSRLECEASFSMAVPAEKKKDNFGVSAHFARFENIISTMPMLNKMGAKMLRDECLWKDYEKTKGTYALTDTQKNYINSAAENGLEQLVILGYQNSLYGIDEESYPKTKDQLAAFGEYVYNLVSDLKGKVTYFEVWNEFDIFYNKGDKDAAAYYAKLLKVAYQKAKEANPDAKIVGLVSAGVNIYYFDDLLKADSNVGNYMDIISFHLYAMGNSPESAYYTSSMNYSVRELKKRFGSDKEMWLTEMGWSEYEKDGTPNDNTDGKRINEAEAAKYRVRCVLRNDAEWNFSKIFDYTWNDRESTIDNREAFFGNINSDYSAKKSYIAYSAMNNFIGNGTFIEREADSDGNYMQSYRTDFDEVVTVIFNSQDKQSSADVIPVYTACTFYDMYGNEISADEDNGEYIVQTSGEPVYMVQKKEAVHMDYKTNTAEIYGEITGANPGEQIMIYVLKPGKTKEDILDMTALSYIAQEAVKENGVYDFSFSLTGGAGEYKIYIGYEGSKGLIGPISVNVKRDVSAKLGAYGDGKEFVNMNEILSSPEQSITFKGIISNKYNAALNAVLYAAGYDSNNKMLWSDFVEGAVNKFGDNEIKLSVDKEQILDNGEIKVFLWTDNQKPIVGVKPFNAAEY